MKEMLRPYLSEGEYYAHTREGSKIETLHICKFCRRPLLDQTLLSWDMCCGEFESQLQVDELTAAANYALTHDCRGDTLDDVLLTVAKLDLIVRQDDEA